MKKQYLNTRMSFSLFFFLLGFSGFSFLNAQWLTLPDSGLWPTTPDTGLVIGYGEFPRIVSDKNGGAIVVFRTDSPWIVKAKRVDKWGALQWNGWSGVVVGGTGDWKIFDYFNSGDVAEDGSGGVFVGFSDIHCNGCGDPWEGEISYATVQKIDHEGNKLWGEGIRVTALDSVYQLSVEVERDGNGGCIVSWLKKQSAQGIEANYDLYIQRINSLGNRVWGDSAIRITTIPDIQSRLPMTVNEHGSTFFIWWDGSDIRVQKVNINGVKLWGEEGIIANETPGAVGISNKQGGIILAGNLYSFSTGTFRLLCQNIDSTGQKLWGANSILLADSININYSRVSGLFLNDENNLFVSYYYSTSNQPDLYLQKLTPDGSKLFGTNGILVSDYPSVKRGLMIQSENNVLCLWYDVSRQGYYIQKLDFLGNRIWSEDKLFSFDGSSLITPDGYGGIIMAYKGADFSINLTKISKNGIIGEVIYPTSIGEQEKIDPPRNLILFQNYPNPFNPVTTISYFLPQSSKVTLIIYNILGQEIKRVVNKLKPAGYHAVLWDGTNNDNNQVSSGTYIYRLETEQTILQKKLVLLR